MNRLPLIGITADAIMMRNILPGAGVYDVYSRAVVKGAQGLPWIIPPLGEELDLDALIERMDGILFTGSRTNIQPHHYDGGPPPPDNPEDPQRDSTTLPLIRKALEAGVPMLCICRGMQELNVALGGTLHQEVHKVPGRADHRAPEDRPPEERFGPAHDISIVPGGMLARLTDNPRETVNSVHGQGIDRLAPGLRIEARADDGSIEAVFAESAPAFALGVQWHPEWGFSENPFYRAIWETFGTATRGRLASR